MTNLHYIQLVQLLNSKISGENSLRSCMILTLQYKPQLIRKPQAGATCEIKMDYWMRITPKKTNMTNNGEFQPFGQGLSEKKSSFPFLFH